ncbi:MAG: hypothetical protein ACREEG_02780 [Phenylobacterium sp.]
MRQRLTLICTSAALMFSSSTWAADRIEAVTPARLAVRSNCIVAPATATIEERAADAKESAFGLALATVGAKFIGDLAGAGLAALGDAISTASQEHGYVAEAQSHYSFYQIRLPKNGRKIADLQQKSVCLILYVPSSTGVVEDMKTSPELKKLDDFGRPSGKGLQLLDPTGEADAEAALKDIGLSTVPAVYIEAELWPAADGMIVRPVLVWYHEQLKGAPKTAAAAELHATFATPSSATGSTALGATFALAVIKLPTLTPGATALGPWDLAGRGIVGIPARPTTGSADTALAAANSIYAAAATSEAELGQAVTTLATAKRALARGKTAAAEEAVFVATEAVAAKTKSRDEARAAAATVKSVNVGTTNVQERFVVIRDANKFGLAIGAALKARSTDLNTAVTAALTPKGPTPDWALTDTAYLQAATNITAKQREIDAAAASGDASAVARLNGEMVILQAKANEAAVAASRALPYPNLLASVP